MRLQGSHRTGKNGLGPGKKCLLSWNCPGILSNHPWKYELVFEKYKNTTIPFRFMGCAKKLWANRKKNWMKIVRYTSKSEVQFVFYSIQFVR